MKLNQSLLLITTSLAVSTVSLYANAAELKGHSSTLNRPATTETLVAQRSAEFAVPRSTHRSMQSSTVAMMSGMFKAAEKPTTGMVRIVNEGGHRYLEFDAAFSTSELGPDLHVLLDPSTQPPQSYEELGRVINLGKLQSYQGAQRYPIPDTIDLGQFKSVVIWCRMANATFGYAPLQ